MSIISKLKESQVEAERAKLASTKKAREEFDHLVCKIVDTTDTTKDLKQSAQILASLDKDVAYLELAVEREKELRRLRVLPGELDKHTATKTKAAEDYNDLLELIQRRQWAREIIDKSLKARAETYSVACGNAVSESRAALDAYTKLLEAEPMPLSDFYISIDRPEAHDPSHLIEHGRDYHRRAINEAEQHLRGPISLINYDDEQIKS